MAVNRNDNAFIGSGTVAARTSIPHSLSNIVALMKLRVYTSLKGYWHKKNFVLHKKTDLYLNELAEFEDKKWFKTPNCSSHL